MLFHRKIVVVRDVRVQEMDGRVVSEVEELADKRRRMLLYGVVLLVRRRGGARIAPVGETEHEVRIHLVRRSEARLPDVLCQRARCDVLQVCWARPRRTWALRAGDRIERALYRVEQTRPKTIFAVEVVVPELTRRISARHIVQSVCEPVEPHA